MSKIMIASDIHGDAECAKALFERFEELGADKILLLGDLLYHGPRNDLPAGYAPKRVIEILNSYKEKIMTVRGNCDTEVDQMVLSFPILADYAYLTLDGISAFATHGHKFGFDNPPPLSAGELLLCGHTHVPCVKAFGNNNFYINAGSVSIPKENSHKSFLIYEKRGFEFFSLDGEKYDEFVL